MTSGRITGDTPYCLAYDRSPGGATSSAMLEWRLLQRTLFSTTSEMQTKSLAVHPTTLISAEKKEEDMPSSGEEDTESGAAESLPAGAGERTVVEEPAAQDKAFVKAKEPETEPILHPGPNDVLMGRGAPSTDYPGNLYFRELVKQRRDEYVNVKRRKEKQIVAGEIVATIKKRGGRFLERVETYRSTNEKGQSTKTTVWNPVEDKKTLLVKVKQAMRDVGPEAQEKRLRRREMRRRGQSGSPSHVAGESPNKKPPATPQTSAFSGTNAQSHLNLSMGGASSVHGQLLPPSAISVAGQSLAGLQGFTGLSAADEYMLRLRLEQEAALRQELLLRQQMQQSHGFTGGLPLGLGMRNPLFMLNRESLLEQSIKAAQEEAILQHQMQQRAQMLMQQPPSTLSVLSLPAAISTGAPASRTQPQSSSPQGDLLASILQGKDHTSSEADQEKDPGESVGRDE